MSDTVQVFPGGFPCVSLYTLPSYVSVDDSVQSPVDGCRCIVRVFEHDVHFAQRVLRNIFTKHDVCTTYCIPTYVPHNCIHDVMRNTFTFGIYRHDGEAVARPWRGRGEAWRGRAFSSSRDTLVAFSSSRDTLVTLTEGEYPVGADERNRGQNYGGQILQVRASEFLRAWLCVMSSLLFVTLTA
eukprot:1335386-Amorphochlora_amoeboformis.AAC.1